MEFKEILFEENGHAAFITLNNPKDMNPLNVDVAKELIECLNYVEKNDDIRALVIRGAGGNFSGGGNVKLMKKRIEETGKSDSRPGVRGLGEFIIRLKTLKKPTIAWLEGAVAGAGVSVAMACDFSIADEKCKFVFAFVNIGFIPDMGATYLVTRSVGTVKATELFMSGRKFSGVEAVNMGLITTALPYENLEETVMKYVDKYSNGPTVSYANIKTMINRACFSELGNGLQSEVEAQYECGCTQDHKEAIAAFFEKRKPDFQGK